jgi:signal transduction histidine kinase
LHSTRGRSARRKQRRISEAPTTLGSITEGIDRQHFFSRMPDLNLMDGSELLRRRPPYVKMHRIPRCVPSVSHCVESMEHPPSIDNYATTLAMYIDDRSEASLYRASSMSQLFIEAGLGPEDITALHYEALDAAMKHYSPRDLPRVVGDAHQFLLEIMIAYGVKYREYLELKLEEGLRDAEARSRLDRERTSELERVQRERSEILASIAHELRTPLTAAIGQIDLASRILSRGNIEQLPPMLGSAREALDRLSRLSGDLVESSRHGPPELTFTQQDLHHVVGQAFDWARPAANAKGVMLFRESSGEPIMMDANADALLSILGNLLSNAVRYTPTGGQVIVHDEVSGDEALVEVRDTGIGMTPEVRARVFEKFYRAPEARNLDARGLGLGLSLAKQLVEAHHGRLELESEPDQGTTIRIHFPLTHDGLEEPLDRDA